MNVISLFIRNYSVLRGIGDSSFLFELSLPSGTYAFIYVDALLKIGLKRPFNFFGILDEVQYNTQVTLTLYRYHYRKYHKITFLNIDAY